MALFFLSAVPKVALFLLSAAYPAFGGTRDHRLVQIMKRRIDSFSLLLGGVQGIPDEEHQGDEAWRSKVIEAARGKLAGLGSRLTVEGD